jgi:hypothetical protein
MGSRVTAYVDHWAATWAFKPMRRLSRPPPLGSCRSLPILRLARPQGWTVNEIPSTPPGRGTRQRPSPRRGHRSSRRRSLAVGRGSGCSAARKVAHGIAAWRRRSLRRIADQRAAHRLAACTTAAKRNGTSPVPAAPLTSLKADRAAWTRPTFRGNSRQS